MKNIVTYSLFVFFLNCLIGNAQILIPESSGKVVSDFSEILSHDQEEILAQQIKKVYSETGNQLFVVTIPTSYYSETSIVDYSQKLFDKWAPGQKGVDNGVLLIIGGSKTDSLNRALRIHTGYGIEYMLTDIECARIQQNFILPELKQFHYFKALSIGVSEILNRISMYKIVKKSPLNTISFSISDAIQDNAHCFTNEQLRVLRSANTSIFGFPVSKVTTSFYEYTKSGVEDGTFYSNSKFNLELNITPWILVPVKDSSLINIRGEHKYGLKVNSAIIDVDESNHYFTSNGYFKTILFCVKKNSEYQTASFIYFFILICIPFIFLFTTLKLLKLHKIGYYTAESMKNHFLIVKVIAWIIYIVSFLQVLSLTFFHTFLTYSEMQNSGLLTSDSKLIIIAIICITNFSIYLFALVKIKYFLEGPMMINFNAFGSRGSGVSYSSNSSSYSSFSSSNSSRSSTSSSSSSNSGYFGGGGKSGGGGASSKW